MTASALGLAVSTSLTGCATMLRASYPASPDERPALAVECRPIGEGVRVIARPTQGKGSPNLGAVGFLLDLALGLGFGLLPSRESGNVVRTPATAGLIAAGTATVIGVDLAIASILESQGKLPIESGVQRVEVRTADGGRALGTARPRYVSLAAGGPYLVADIPLTASLPEAVSVALVGTSGTVLASVPASLGQNQLAAMGTATEADLAANSAPPAAPLAVTTVPPARATAATTGLASDVDQMAAPPRTPDPDAVGIVIGIEDYGEQIPPVQFAARDAEIMARYMQDVLGVPPENLMVLIDGKATKGAIQTAIEGKLPAFVNPGRSRVYVYYAGHGAPDIESKTPYLVPSDGNPDFARSSCYPLDAVYQALGNSGARSTVVMLDACFTGVAGRSDRTAGLLARARPLAVVPVAGALPPRVTLLAGATGEQVSSGFPDKGHGLFTYYLLKAMQMASARSVKLTLSDVHRYLSDTVPRQARRQGRTQTPVLLGEGAGEVLISP